MRGHSEGGARRGWAGVLRWGEGLLVIGGLAMLTWCAAVVSDAYIAQRIARQSLDTISRVAPPARPPTGASPGTSKARPIVSRGAAIAALSIPRVDLSAVVLHGSDDYTLRRGPGHLEDTAMPGEIGNTVIAGHRDSFFRPLRYIRLGDDIFLDTPHGRVQYRVISLKIVQPRDLSVIAPTDAEVLTLITCYPFRILGNAPDRFVVRAARVTKATAVPPPATPVGGPANPSAQRSRAPEGDTGAVQSRTPIDDETLVRQAIERFRLTYNARLVSRNDHRPGGLLRFRTCDVSVDGDQAAAQCRAVSDSQDDREPHVWTSTLRRTDGGWAITQIASAD